MILGALLDLIYPRLCCYCERECDEGVFCLSCEQKAGITDQFEIDDPEIRNKLMGHPILGFTAALYYYHKSGIIQKLVHLIKFGKRKDLAYLLGKSFAKHYLKTTKEDYAECVICIPVHWRRRMKRGYNQCEEFGKGICSFTGQRLLKNVLLKRRHEESQTGKGRAGRFEQVKKSFYINKAERIKGKSILLIDDVLTTGATLEAAVVLLSDAGVREIQIGLMAQALN